MKKLLQLVLVSSVLLFIGCGKDDDGNDINPKTYGEVGSHGISIHTNPNDAYTSIYYPTDIADMSEKIPLIFFASGWFGNPEDATKYETLLKFIASHGYAVIYTDEGATTDFQHSINGFENGLHTDFTKDNLLPHIDTTNIGIIGHSAGGGIAFTILDYFSKAGYGEKGRFLLALDPWYAFDMNTSDMQNLPANTNVVIVKFGEGGNNDTDGTDARIPLTEYYLLESIADNKKDYQIYAAADHGYPTGNGAYADMQGILKPLDALLDYTFVKQTEEIRIIALENGNDDPYANGAGIQVVKPKADYPYPCDGAANTLIDYCEIIP